MGALLVGSDHMRARLFEPGVSLVILLFLPGGDNYR